MAPKKAAAETSSSPNTTAEKELKEEQKTDGPEEVSKAVRKVSSHPSTMEMVKEALTELDQRKGVSAQAVRTFIKEKYATVDETRLKTMVRKALVKGIDSGAFVRPANSTNTTGAQGRFRLSVRKPKASKRKEAKENTNPINQAKAPNTKTGDVKTKKSKSAAVGGDKPKKTKKNEVSASKVAPAKKPKAKRAAGAADEGEPEPKHQKTSKDSKGEGDEKSGAKKGGKKASRKTPEGLDAEGNLVKKGEKKEAQKSEDGGNEAEATAQKKGGRKTPQKAEDGEKSGTKSSGKKGKKAAGK